MDTATNGEATLAGAAGTAASGYAGDAIATHSGDVTATSAEHVVDANTEDVAGTDTAGIAGTDAEDFASTGAEDAVDMDIGNVVGMDTEDIVGTDTENLITTEVEDAVATGTPATSPVSLDDIDDATIPIFLLRHGTGSRQVNIFNYLKSVKDLHFQRVLFYYLRFEINTGSEPNRTLPTTKRPPEIALWTAKARPAGLPNYKKGKRSFATFVDSVLEWWAFIQPPWRTFARGRVSRKVHGGWDVLVAPRINGLLNVVVLVYWWFKILEEDKPKGSVRADYELFADDVAWVLSKLST